MLFSLKRSFLFFIAVLGILFISNAQAVNLVLAEKNTIQNPDGTMDIPIIIYFDSKLDVRALRNEVKSSIQAKNLTRKELRRLHKKNTRRAMLNRLKANLLKPYAIVTDFLSSNGIRRRINKLWSVNALALTIPSDLISRVQELEGVERVSIDYAFTLSESTSEVTSGIPLWNLDDINATLLWESDLTGEGVVVGIMDSGVDINHPDLSDKWRGGDNSWFDPYGAHTTPVDFIGHGTQVTGLVVGGDSSGYQIGVAPHAKWIAAKIFDDTGMSNISKISESFQWMMDPDGDSSTDDAPDIINNSWVIEGLTNICTHSLDNIELDILSDNLAKLREAGIAVVFSAGNFGPHPETSLPPANDPSIELSVGSINQNRDVEFTSSRGPGACDGSIYPKLVAPGDSIFTTDKLPNSYNIVSGTSFAAPHVTGAVAQLMSAPFEASLTQIESALRETAGDIDLFGEDNNSGYGLIDVAAAYEWLLSSLDITEAGILLFGSQSYSVDENANKLIVTIRRIGGSKGEVSIDYQTHDGTAQGFADTDYLSTHGTLTFNDSETSRTFEISIKDDAIDEDNEDFSIELSNPTGDALLGNRTIAPVVILDDDGPGELSLESSSYAISENSDSIELIVLRTGGYEGAVSIDYSTSDDTADDITDYRAIDGRLAFEDGERSKIVTIEIINDDAFEANETFNLRLSNPLGGADFSEIDSSSITILNDDVNPLTTVIQLESTNYESLENSGVVQITLRRLGDTSNEVTVDYSTSDGSALGGEDYEKASGTVKFAAGQNSQTILISIDILDDTQYEGTESFNLALFNATNDAQLGAPTTSIITIKDNDAIPFVSLSSVNGTLSDSSNSLADSNSNETETQSTDNESDTSQNSSLMIHNLSLAGFSGLGSIYNDDLSLATVTSIESTGSDKDQDGYVEGIDCNDHDPSIHPGSSEIKHDGVDQDCNGYDLTIDLERFEYPSTPAKTGRVEATTHLNSRAELSLTVKTQDGTRITEDMRWNSSTNRWQSNLYDYIKLLGVKPRSITVTGTEGSETGSLR